MMNAMGCRKKTAKQIKHVVMKKIKYVIKQIEKRIKEAVEYGDRSAFYNYSENDISSVGKQWVIKYFELLGYEIEDCTKCKVFSINW